MCFFSVVLCFCLLRYISPLNRLTWNPEVDGTELIKQLRDTWESNQFTEGHLWKAKGGALYQDVYMSTHHIYMSAVNKILSMFIHVFFLFSVGNTPKIVFFPHNYTTVNCGRAQMLN